MDNRQELLDLLEQASNLLHGPLAFMSEPARSAHKRAVDEWMDKYEAATEHD